MAPTITTLNIVNRKLLLAIVLIVSTLCFHSAASTQADIVIEFSDGSTTGTTFDIDVGSTKIISIFLTESDTNTELSADGLIGYGLRADYGATSDASSLITDYNHNPDFNFDFARTFDASSLDVAASAIGVPAVTGTSVLLGEMSVQVSATGTTAFSFNDRTDVLSDFATESGVDLDPIIFTGGRAFGLTIVGVTAVPEPSSCAILLGITLGGLLHRRRRN